MDNGSSCETVYFSLENEDLLNQTDWESSKNIDPIYMIILALMVTEMWL